MKFTKAIIILAIFSVACFTFSTAAVADDVTDYINEALQYYKDGAYSDAVDSLNYAEQMIQQKKSTGLEAFLPEPIKGWTAETSTSQAANSAMLGGGISAERSYTKGNSSIEIQIMADSPMLQGVMMMMSNPMFAASDGGKLKLRPDIPVILCMGYSKKLSDEEAIENGIKAFQMKPLIKKELAKTVRKVLDDKKLS